MMRVSLLIQQNIKNLFYKEKTPEFCKSIQGFIISGF